MNLTVEAIEALRAQGVPPEAVLDALQAALKVRIESDREKARLRQQKSRAARRPRRAVSAPCHSDQRDPSSDKKKNPPDPLKEKTNPIQAEPPSSAPAATTLPDDWTPTEAHVAEAAVECLTALDPDVRQEAEQLGCLDSGVKVFADRFVDHQAGRFQAWAWTWNRTHPDWDLRFSEWLRREFAELRRQRRCPALARQTDRDAILLIDLNEDITMHARMTRIMREESPTYADH